MNTTPPVRAWKESVVLPTYEPLPPDRNPMFLERRIYQGSSGKVYPLPFIDRISTRKTDHSWNAVFIENEFLRVMLLPEIGGRIHAILDKTNNYDVIYRQDVIKPALVGLAGPWASGGIEFNWPQHHRPSTYMPTDVSIESHPDGSITAWMSEHDPMSRMKGMHGLCLHPGKSVVELKVRLYNRTPFTQSFLWWANVATKVHENYQSFFPLDVSYVADHARRATSRYPFCDAHYYGVDYASRAQGGVPPDQSPRKFPPRPDTAANDLSWYANIPVPTSYMCLGSQQDFVGGYDHSARAGLIHVANHHIAPGKKQWTWGNHDFGYSWDRNLSDDDAPYIELMAGVYTDNQPDFSFLSPGETRTFSQFWYPIRDIGPAQQANVDAAVSLLQKNRHLRLAAITTAVHEDATITLESKTQILFQKTTLLSPSHPFVHQLDLPAEIPPTDLRLSITTPDGQTLITYQPQAPLASDPPNPATEPPAPADVPSTDELFTIGLHLSQYRHATRHPDSYWREALRRDPLDCRCNNALGLWHLRRGEFDSAESHFRSSLQRQTSRNPNPLDGEPSYHLGLTLRLLHRDDEAYASFYKSTWNYAQQSPAYLALAEIDCTRQSWPAALDHLDRCLKVNADHLLARDLKAIVLRRLGRAKEADSLLQQTLSLDPLDFLAHFLLGRPLTCDTQTRLDLSLDLARAGLYPEALDLLKNAAPEPSSGAAPLLHYYRAYFTTLAGDPPAAQPHLLAASRAAPDYCFPARLEEILILRSAIESNPTDANAPYYLANLLYDRLRHQEAITLWERSISLNPSFSIPWRNLGIAYFNILNNPAKSLSAYKQALLCAPDDARLLFEQDQLWKRIGLPPADRLAELERHPHLLPQRDDLSVELCALYNLLGRHHDALSILSTRHFQPWEGGEGQALTQYVRTRLSLGRQSLSDNNLPAALTHFQHALTPPANLGESRHLLANHSDIHYFLGLAHTAAGNQKSAHHHFTAAANSKGDFQDMSLRAYSEMTYYSALSLHHLNRTAESTQLLQDLLHYATTLRTTPAKIDYFATSLPTMLLFNDDLQRRQETTALFLEAQSHLARNNLSKAHSLLTTILTRDPSHPLAADLLTSLPQMINQ